MIRKEPLDEDVKIEQHALKLCDEGAFESSLYSCNVGITTLAAAGLRCRCPQVKWLLVTLGVRHTSSIYVNYVARLLSACGSENTRLRDLRCV